MFVNLEKSWEKQLQSELQKDYFQELLKKVEQNIGYTIVILLKI